MLCPDFVRMAHVLGILTVKNDSETKDAVAKVQTDILKPEVRLWLTPESGEREIRDVHEANQLKIVRPKKDSYLPQKKHRNKSP